MIYLFSIVGLFAPPELHWIVQDFLFMGALSAFIAVKLWQKFNPAFGLFYLLAMGSGLFICFFTPLTHYQIYSTEIKNMACIHIALSLLWITSFAIFFLFLKQKLNSSLMKMFVYLAIIDAFIMVFHDHYWVMGNHAADASFLACCLPLICYFADGPLWGIYFIWMLIEILLTKSVTGISAVGIEMVLWGLFMFGKTSLKATLPLLVTGAFLVSKFMNWYRMPGIIANNNSLFNDNGRFHLWKISWQYFSEHFYPYFGSGPGTFYTWGPHIQNIHPETSGGIFFWVHNDWLQILFEMGIIGLILALFIFIFALYKLKNNGYLFTSLFLFGYVSLTQFPLRQPIFALLGGWLLFNAFSKEDRLVLE